jgi:hypothetical protein
MFVRNNIARDDAPRHALLIRDKSDAMQEVLVNQALFAFAFSCSQRAGMFARTSEAILKTHRALCDRKAPRGARTRFLKRNAAFFSAL